MEPERIDVILGGLLDVANRNLWNRLGKAREHVPQLSVGTEDTAILIGEVTWQEHTNSSSWSVHLRRALRRRPRQRLWKRPSPSTTWTGSKWSGKAGGS